MPKVQKKITGAKTTLSPYPPPPQEPSHVVLQHSDSQDFGKNVDSDGLDARIPTLNQQRNKQLIY